MSWHIYTSYPRILERDTTHLQQFLQVCTCKMLLFSIFLKFNINLLEDICIYYSIQNMGILNGYMRAKPHGKNSSGILVQIGDS